jgi:MSHA biogenesis protein MshJ
MSATSDFRLRCAAFTQRFDALAVRERALIFAAVVAMVCFGWQSLLMSPLLARQKQVEQRLSQARLQIATIEATGSMVSNDPLTAAAARNGALKGRLSALANELSALSQGYVAPERMSELLRQMLADQHGLTLLSLENLPVESLSQPVRTDSLPAERHLQPGDRGPFLHPVEMVVEGDFANTVAYLRALEQLPWRLHWQRLELTVVNYPVNRTRIVIGALSLSRDWINV